MSSKLLIYFDWLSGQKLGFVLFQAAWGGVAAALGTEDGVSAALLRTPTADIHTSGHPRITQPMAWQL